MAASVSITTQSRNPFLSQTVSNSFSSQTGYVTNPSFVVSQKSIFTVSRNPKNPYCRGASPAFRTLCRSNSLSSVPPDSPWLSSSFSLLNPNSSDFPADQNRHASSSKSDLQNPSPGE